jgi:L-seryl-tRNA(Ser) seleniumtransferase
MTENLLRQLPQVERLLQLPGLAEATRSAPRRVVTDAVRAVLQGLREEILSASVTEAELQSRLSDVALEERCKEELERLSHSGYRRVINGTGVILHTGLGRAVFCDEARRALTHELGGYSLVEVDAESGERNRREDAVAGLLCDLTGAEEATVVNNNAAATLLILAAYARGREVIVSRGQLVEIGGSFRIPDILRESGARLVEVGTTNRTYVDDYRKALTPETGLLLQVHTSNYAIKGFAQETPLEELVALGQEAAMPVVSDLGSGCFVDLAPYGFAPEPLVSDRVRTGVDLVCFSGDKLLGGPQAGVIVGRRDGVERVRNHPLYRALRVDKATLVGLEATLRCYQDPETLAATMPVLRAITTPVEAIEARVERALGAVRAAGTPLDVRRVVSTAQAGSGALPAQEIASCALALRHNELTTEALASKLRLGAPPLFCRIQSDQVLIDFRTVLPHEDDAVVALLGAV